MLGRIAEVDHKFQSEKTCCIKELISAKVAYFLHCLILIPFLSILVCLWSKQGT